LLDVTPLTLGIETTGGIMNEIIPRNTVIPTKKTKRYHTHNVEDTSTSISVFEGERPMTKDNHHLGQFNMVGFPGTEEGRQHDVTLTIDSNGILEVTDVIVSSQKSMSITIGNDGSRLNEKQIEKMLREAKLYEEEDKKMKAQMDAKVAFETYLKSAERSLQDDKGLGGQVTDEEKESMKDALKNGQEWIDSHPAAEVEEITAQKEEVQAICDPIIRRYSGAGDGSANEEEEEDEDHQEL